MRNYTERNEDTAQAEINVEMNWIPSNQILQSERNWKRENWTRREADPIYQKKTKKL